MRPRISLECAFLVALIFVGGAQEARLKAQGALLDAMASRPRLFEQNASWGPRAACTSLMAIETAGGTRVEFPEWLMDLPQAALGCMVEVDACVGAFSTNWGSEVQPTRVVVYPLGLEAFPHDGCALAEGRYFPEDGTIVVALSLENDKPFLPALPHELVHRADMTILHGAHDDFDDPRATAAMAAAQAAVRQIYGRQ